MPLSDFLLSWDVKNNNVWKRGNGGENEKEKFFNINPYIHFWSCIFKHDQHTIEIISVPTKSIKYQPLQEQEKLR